MELLVITQRRGSLEDESHSRVLTKICIMTKIVMFIIESWKCWLKTFGYTREARKMNVELLKEKGISMAEGIA